MAEEVFGVTETLVKDDEQNKKFHAKAAAAIKEAVEIIDSEDWATKKGWKFEQENTETGDKCYSKTLNKNKAFCIVGEIAVPVEKLFYEVNENVAETPKWNPSVLEYRILFPLGEQTDVVYSVTADALGGLVSSRDLVSVRIWRKIGESYYMSGISIEWDGMKPQKGKVRAYGYPGMMKITPVEGKPDHCTMEWMMNTDLKGFLPKSVVSRFMTSMFMEYIGCLRKHAVAKSEKE